MILRPRGAIGPPIHAHAAASRTRWPVSDCISSRWPLPETPATPTISPVRTVRLNASQRRLAAIAAHRQALDLQHRRADTIGQALPGHWIAHRAALADHRLGQNVGTRARHARAHHQAAPAQHADVVGIGRDLAELVRDQHDAAGAGVRARRAAPSTSSASWGVSTEVGSSRINSRGRRNNCLRISSFCFSPADKSSGVASSGN